MRLRTLLFTLCTVAVVAPLVGPGAAGAGTLDFDPAGAPAIGDFSPVTLNGTAQLASLAIAPFTINDATASGAGWHVTLSIDDLVNGGATISASGMTMGAPVVTPVGLADITGVAGHAATGSLGAGEKIVTADIGAGVGSYMVSPQPVQVEVPANALAGTYTGAASLSVVSGP